MEEQFLSYKNINTSKNDIVLFENNQEVQGDLASSVYQPSHSKNPRRRIPIPTIVNCKNVMIV